MVPARRSRGAKTTLACGIALALLVVWNPAPAGADETWTTRLLWQPPDPGFTYMDDVSCSGRGRCFAVGRRWNAEPETNTTAIEAWDGAAWSPVASPNPPGPPGGSSGALLKSVWCKSPVDCIAVGQCRGTVPVLGEGPDEVLAIAAGSMSFVELGSLSCRATHPTN